MTKKNVLRASLFLFVLWGCNDKQEYTKQGAMKYLKGDQECYDYDQGHWLIDLEIKDGKDSLILNTNTLGRKVEINSKQLDTNASLIQLLSGVCAKDSISIVLNADSFYSSLGGKAPLNLDKTKPIHVKLWMRDKLSDIKYLAHKQAFENEGVQRFIQKSGWNGQQDTNTLIYYEILKTSPNERRTFQKAKLKYVIKSLNETIIAYSKDGDPLVYDKSDKSILRGIRFLADKLSVGESLRAIVPSPYAFGPDGNSKVPGYMPIIIELELLEILE